MAGLGPLSPQLTRDRLQGAPLPTDGKAKAAATGPGAAWGRSHACAKAPTPAPAASPRARAGSPPSRRPPALRARGNQDLEGERRASGAGLQADGAGAHPRSPVLETTGPPGLQGSEGSSWRPPRPSLSSTVCSLAQRPAVPSALLWGRRKEGGLQSETSRPVPLLLPRTPPTPGWGSLPALTRPHPLGHAYSAASPRGQSFSSALCVSVSPGAGDPARISTCFFREEEGAGLLAPARHSSSR